MTGLLAAVAALVLALAGCEKPAGRIGDGLPETTEQAPPLATPTATTYRSCQEAQEADAAPLHEGDPGYNTRLDTDRDGTACE